MKFMLMMNTPRDGYAWYMSWPKEVIEANVAFMKEFSRKLSAAGELVGTEGLASPVQAKLVRADKDGKYRVSNVPAGEYLAVAVPDKLIADWQRPKFLESLMPSATRFRVQDGDKVVQNLKVAR